MPNPTAAMLVIGDEILSGRTRDSNLHYLAGELTQPASPLPKRGWWPTIMARLLPR